MGEGGREEKEDGEEAEGEEGKPGTPLIPQSCFAQTMADPWTSGLLPAVPESVRRPWDVYEDTLAEPQVQRRPM